MPKHLISYAALAVASFTASRTSASEALPAVIDAAAIDDIIVTGTRTKGLRAADSAAPIKVLDAEALVHVGQPNLNQVLSQLVPSFTTEAVGGDTANLTLSARLRGLSPNHVLVLIDGKRRHSTANLHVLGGQFQGGAAPDLDLIPPAAIERIEVLEDGAAAQYGSDAIAGVINIILKKGAEGGMASATGGGFYKNGGGTYAGTANVGLPLGKDGFANITVFHRYHNYSDQGGSDARLSNPDGTIKTSLSPALQAAYLAVPGYPHVNHINGDARSYLSTIMFNSGYDFAGVEAYSFGGYSHRSAASFENFRVPDRVRASPVLGVRGNFTDPGELIFAPQGFNPKEALVEDDYSITGGFKGDFGNWHWDLSSTYGIDHDRISTLDSANAALFVDTHFTPTNFYDGAFINSEWTNNLDISRDFDIGMAGPLNVAFGAEHRRDSYEIRAGDPASIYKEGGQSYPGFQPTDAAKHSRTNIAGYLDLALEPMDGLKVDAAVRYEHYTDFGSKVVEKLTARYDFTRAFALRGTVATGFRAPTLAEEYYSATNVSPTAAIVQLPANSAASTLLGFAPLAPEKSTNFSVGVVARPVSALTITLDAYQVKINNRIVATGTIYGSGGAVNSPAVLAAIAAHGNILDPTVTFTGVSVFTNGIDTRTRGVEFTAAYNSDFGSMGTVSWSASANYNETAITKQRTSPGPISSQPLFNQTATSLLTNGSPKVKVVLDALYEYKALTINLRETIFGKTSAYLSPNGGNYYYNAVGTSALTDLEIGYKITKGIALAAGANNLFNKRPPSYALTPTGGISNGGNVYDVPLGISPYGINGGYYYGRITVSF